MRKLLFILLLCITTSASGQFFAPNQKPMLGLKANWGHPLVPTVFWLFNENSGGQVFDLSGNNNTGTLTGTAPSWSAGKFGSAVLLPGTNEYILLSNNSIQIGSGDITVICWAYINGSGDYRGLVSTKNTGAPGTQKGYVLGFTSTIQDQILWQVDDGAGTSSALIANPPPVGWHQIVGRFINGVELRIFLDGISVSVDNTGIPSGDLTSIRTPVIGAFANPSLYFNDKIDNVSVYNRALSASEIAQLYREPFCFMQPSWNWTMFVPFLAVPAIGGQVIFIN